MRPVLSGSGHRFAIFRQPPCFTGRGAGEGRLRATSGLSHGQAEGLFVTPSRPSGHLVWDCLVCIGRVRVTVSSYKVEEDAKGHRRVATARVVEVPTGDSRTPIGENLHKPVIGQ
jgi:hypothetical protein